MEAVILKKTKKLLIISWKNSTEFGRIELAYDEYGKYILDAEYIGIDQLIKIFKVINLNNKKDARGKISN